MTTIPARALTALRRRALKNPDDQAAHLAFADALSNWGDELGELIRKMVHEGNVPLPASLKVRLLGRLANCMTSWEVQYGFLRTVGLSPMEVTQFRGLVGIREWEGVTRLVITPLELPLQAPTDWYEDPDSDQYGNPYHHYPLENDQWDVEPPPPPPIPGEEVLLLVRKRVCSQLRVLQGLAFGAFVGLCRERRHFDRIDVIDLPQEGVNIPLLRANLNVRELGLHGHANAVIPWLKTCAREVFDRVEVFHIFGQQDGGIDLLLERPAAAKQVMSPYCCHAYENNGDTRWSAPAGARQPYRR